MNSTVSTERIANDLASGTRSYGAWRDEVGRSGEPTELPHTRVCADFVPHAWPQPAREAVERAGTSLAYAWTWRPTVSISPGTDDALPGIKQQQSVARQRARRTLHPRVRRRM